MWKLRISRSFERAIRQIPKEYQRRIVAWHDEHAEGISDPTDIDTIQSGFGAASPIRDLGYTYDLADNVTARFDHVQGIRATGTS